MNIIRSLQIKHFTALFHQYRFKSELTLTNDQIDRLRQEIDDNKIFQEIKIDDYYHLFDLYPKPKIANVIDIYENMKYNLENVPTTLKSQDIIQAVSLNNQNIKRLIEKLYRKELNKLLRKELNKKSPKTYLDSNGLFDKDNNLKYGLWNNCLFIRIRNPQKKFFPSKLRISVLFGQNLYIDFSFSNLLSDHISNRVANSIANIINHNYKALKDPFNIILTGIDYDHYLWNTLNSKFSTITDSIQHTDKSYLQLISDKSNIAYFTSLERNKFLQYNPDQHFVIAAISEKDIQNRYILGALKKLKVKTFGIPVNQHVIWNKGSKRFNITQKFNILNDLRYDNDWKNIIKKNVRPDQIKTLEMIRNEDKIIFNKYRKMLQK